MEQRSAKGTGQVSPKEGSQKLLQTLRYELCAYIPLARTQSHGHYDLQGRL